MSGVSAIIFGRLKDNSHGIFIPVRVQKKRPYESSLD